ncbi:MAG: geranylgeranyl reductase family protein [Candidatus Microthrix sp.]|nr:geranylgeranyl reductase family protein [Candidatus Microthrix sp.]MBK7323522.1 geranylgeranyl reductase family protein [Candidatus Microthrix sp.]
MKTTVVVGAGPAGCAAAITLARSGAPVTLIDKATFPRDKICGDVLTTGALRELESLGFSPDGVADWTPVSDVVVRSPTGSVVRFPLPRDDSLHAVVVRRLDLDAALLKHTRSFDVEVLEGEGIAAIDPGADGIEVTTSGGRTIAAGRIIAADGMWSATRKLSGDTVDRYRGDWHAFRQYFTGVTGPAADDLWVSFEPDILPGYFWSFPLGNGRANVGFGIMRHDGISPGNKLDRVHDMAKRWPELLDRPHIRELLGNEATPESPHRAWPIPARIGDLPLVGDRVLYVGDAAAAGDPMTGEGIAQALVTGRLAAEAVVAGGAGVEANYEQAARAALLADHRMSLALTRALSHRKGAAVALALAGATGWTRRNFARWLFEDYPRALVLTPRRWGRGMFTPPGATFER